MNNLKSIFFIAVLLLLGVSSWSENKAGSTVPNSIKNIQDTKDKSTTTQDQSNDKEDEDLTQRIRQSMMDDNTLSSNVKNIKIFTFKGKVTLRGSVNTQQEKDNIYEKAETLAGKGKVVNEIEVLKQ